MGFIANAVRKVTSTLFGGAEESEAPQVIQNTPAAPAAPAANSAQQQVEDNTNVKKKKRGKASLMVDASPTSMSSTGLNI